MTLFNTLVLAWTLLALALVPVQLRVTAPYGRHVREGWGLGIPNRLGWFAMEFVSLATFSTLFLCGATPKSAPMWVFFGLWVAHYAHRSLVFPFRLRTGGKTIPFSIVAGAVCFNLVNGGLNGFYLGSLAQTYPVAWLTDIRFVAGVAIFLLGAAINIWADGRLIALRTGADTTGYAIPRGGLFEYVSCPNHLGEVIQWWGFALLCWNLPALSFAVWTSANLIPRALSHHAWYRKHFAQYPRGRRAVIPFLL
jgi:3-oxo-5-alpha-steroid 4-dehydrogenase 1